MLGANLSSVQNRVLPMIPQKCLRYAYPIIVLCRYCSRLQYRLFGGVQPNPTATSAARNIMLRSTQLRCPSGFCSTRRSVTSLGVGARSCVATRAVKQNSNRQATTKPPPAPASSTDRQRGFLLASERLEQLLEEGSLRQASLGCLGAPQRPPPQQGANSPNHDVPHAGCAGPAVQLDALLSGACYTPPAHHCRGCIQPDMLVFAPRSCLCSNKDTVPIDHLDALSAEERLTLFTNLGTLMLLGEILVCWLFGQMDPLGEDRRRPSCTGLV